MSLRPMSKLRLQGFNNLTKTLSFNLYDICYASTPGAAGTLHRLYRRGLQRRTADPDSDYRLQNHRRQYPEHRPAGLRAEGRQCHHADFRGADRVGPHLQHRITRSVAGCGGLPPGQEPHHGPHLPGKPSRHNGISTFRADIDVLTCGRISPLKALNYLIHSFESDIVIMDYRVRGFTRDVTGKKHFIDHPINSIQNFLSKDTRDRYQMIDVNVYQEHVFHTKMILKDFELNNYLFSTDKQDVPPREQAEIERRVRREMAEIFYGENLHKGLQI